MRTYRADLHLHSCLSPCGSLESSPRAIASRARALGLDMVALTDHNSALNCPAFATACAREKLTALFGAEVTCAEEAHCLCLFSDPDAALDFGQHVWQHLLRVPHKPEKWGDQVWVNDQEEIEGEVEFFLVSPTDIPLSELGFEVHRRGGLFIPAHVDRLAMSLVSQLGFVPPGDYDALEVVRPGHTRESLGLPADHPFTLVCDSDAHHPDYMGQRHFAFKAESCNFHGLATALRKGRTETVFDIPCPRR